MLDRVVLTVAVALSILAMAWVSCIAVHANDPRHEVVSSWPRLFC